MARYVVTMQADEGGWWLARVEGVQGVHSDGQTVADALRRVREALSLAIGDEAAQTAELDVVVKALRYVSLRAGPCQRQARPRGRQRGPRTGERGAIHQP